MENNHLKRGDRVLVDQNNSSHKIIRNLSDEQQKSIEKSTIVLRASQLYMHYWMDNLNSQDTNDQAWQNMVMYFWKAEEPFPNKSLPPIFETYKVKHFLFEGTPSNLTLQTMRAIPWFGMPGLGLKHLCKLNSKEATIPQLNKLGIIEYFEQTELTNNNLDILTNRAEYFFLIDKRISPFKNGNFYLNDKPIPISLAYSIGGIHIMKKVKLK